MQSCKVSIENLNLSEFSNCKEEIPSIKLSCDSESKICDAIKSECMQETSTDVTQADCTVSDAQNVNTPVSTCTEEKTQSDCEADKSPTDKHIDAVHVESTSEYICVKQKLFFSDNSSAPCSISEDNFPCSFKSCTSESNDLSVSLLHTRTATSESADEHILTESQKISDCNNLSYSSQLQPVPCKIANDHHSEAISQNSEQHSSVSCSMNIDVSVRSVECTANPVDNITDLPKNVLNDVYSNDSDVLCDTNLSEDINVQMKSSESSEMGSKSSQASVESSSSTKTNCCSATQKRKVSLSEYRLRMKEGSSKRVTSDNIKRSTSTPATAIFETLPEQVTLAPLPLFDVSAESRSPTQTSPKTSKTTKERSKIEKEKEVFIDITEHRENLTERLKREFGFDDDSEGFVSAQSYNKSISENTPTMPLCAQPPPPPPPPPPPRLIRPSQMNTCVSTASSASQFSLSMPIPYARTSYIAPQMPSSQFISVHQTLNTSAITPVHSATTPGVQCSVQPTLLPSSHSFAPTLSGTTLQPSIQHEFITVNAQNYAALVQQTPPPPPPKSFSHVYQTGHM